MHLVGVKLALQGSLGQGSLGSRGSGEGGSDLVGRAERVRQDQRLDLPAADQPAEAGARWTATIIYRPSDPEKRPATVLTSSSMMSSTVPSFSPCLL